MVRRLVSQRWLALTAKTLRNNTTNSPLDRRQNSIFVLTFPAALTDRLRHPLDRTTKCGAAGLAYRFPGQKLVERLTQIVRRNVRCVLRIVDATVIDEFASGIDDISFGRARRAQPIGDL